MRLHKRIAALFGYELIRKRKINDTIEQHLENLFELHGIDCVIDVGANTGQYGTMLRQIGYRGRIVSFEPLASAYAQLETASRDDDEWRVVQSALGHENSTMKINHMSGASLSSFHAPNRYGNLRFKRHMKIVGREEVRVRTLADCWPDIVEGITNPRVYLKLDTQGYDLQVIEGAGEALDRVLGMQSEISMKSLYEDMPHYLTALSRFEQEGFEVTGLYLVSRDPETLATIEYDCVMTRRS